MLLLAVLLGMRAGDICALKFKNLDWRQKLITYTQQKRKDEHAAAASYHWGCHY